MPPGFSCAAISFFTSDSRRRKPCSHGRFRMALFFFIFFFKLLLFFVFIIYYYFWYYYYYYFLFQLLGLFLYFYRPPWGDAHPVEVFGVSLPRAQRHRTTRLQREVRLRFQYDVKFEQAGAHVLQAAAS